MNISDSNLSFIKQQIAKKIDYSTPYYGNNKNCSGVITDRSSFPYTRLYRGKWDSYTPNIVSNQAGYRYIPNSIEKYIPHIPSTLPPTFPEPSNYSVPRKPSHCFELACSTNLPCFKNVIPNPREENITNTLNSVNISP